MNNEIIISTDKSILDINLLHKFLSTSYWAGGRSIEEVKNSVEHSYCFGVYLNNQQIGFARVVTDFTIFAYLMDVFILEDYRGNGYSKRLLNKIFDDEKLSRVKKWLRATKDAHTLYAGFGFEKIKKVERWMEKIVQRK